MIGRVPNKSELSEFLAAKGKDKRAKLVDTLLHDDEYTEEYASHWATVWTNILIGAIRWQWPGFNDQSCWDAEVSP